MAQFLTERVSTPGAGDDAPILACHECGLVHRVPAIPAGSYEAKVAINESWELNYGQGGAQNGPNIPFDVARDGATVTWVAGRSLGATAAGGGGGLRLGATGGATAAWAAAAGSATAGAGGVAGSARSGAIASGAGVVADDPACPGATSTWNKAAVASAAAGASGETSPETGATTAGSFRAAAGGVAGSGGAAGGASNHQPSAASIKPRPRTTPSQKEAPRRGE